MQQGLKTRGWELKSWHARMGLKGQARRTLAGIGLTWDCLLWSIEKVDRIGCKWRDDLFWIVQVVDLTWNGVELLLVGSDFESLYLVCSNTFSTITDFLNSLIWYCRRACKAVVRPHRVEVAMEEVYCETGTHYILVELWHEPLCHHFMWRLKILTFKL